MPDEPAARPPLRILIGGDTFPPDVNGSASFARQLAVGMVERGHHVEVLAPAPTGVKPGRYQEEHSGVVFPVHRIRSWRWVFHQWLRFMLPWRITANSERVIAAVRPDIVHFQSHLVAGRGMAPVAKKHGIRLIGTNHTMPENLIHYMEIFPRPIIEAMVRAQWRDAARIYGMADAVTAPTQRSADYFDRNTGLSGTVAISNGIRLKNYRPEWEPQERNRIVYLGRHDDEKHLEDLIHAVARLDPALDVEAIILGDGDQRQKLIQLAERLGLSYRVHLPGKVSYRELRDTLSRATVFAMPSSAELQSITTMEAMATALPIVACDAVALPHLVDHGVNGYLYPPRDVDALAARLTDVLTAPWEEQLRMKKASLAKIQPHDLDHSLDAFEALYYGESLPDHA